MGIDELLINQAGGSLFAFVPANSVLFSVRFIFNPYLWLSGATDWLKEEGLYISVMSNEEVGVHLGCK